MWSVEMRFREDVMRWVLVAKRAWEWTKGAAAVLELSGLMVYEREDFET